MNKYLIGSAAVVSIVLSACGGGGASGDQGEVADIMMELADEAGFDLDRKCVEEKAAKLSDDDAKKLIAAGPEGDAELSAEGEALGDEMFSCVDLDSFVDALVASLPDDGSVDIDCFKEKLGEMQTADEMTEGMTDAAFSCADLGG